jgi:hypothetical protein
MFHADRRSADRRCHARPEDRARDMRGQGARRGPQVHSERFPFQTNPTARLTPGPHRARGGAVLCRLPLRLRRRLVAAFSFAGFLPEIAKQHLVLSGGRFARLLRGFEGCSLPTFRRSAPSGRRGCRQRDTHWDDRRPPISYGFLSAPRSPSAPLVQSQKVIWPSFQQLSALALTLRGVRSFRDFGE